MRHTTRLFASLFASLLAFTTPAAADGPVVVELYTSQGCSSCPPADAMLHRLVQRPDVIALALHVDYWDYIGWEDIFGKPAHTARQQGYARVAQARSIYTPQMVIAGRDHVVGAKAMEVADLIQAHRATQTGVTIELERTGNRLQINGETQRSLPAGTLVQVVRYIPSQVVNITRGENAGAEFEYTNIVTDWDVAGEWSGAGDLDLSVPVGGTAPVVVIVQQPGAEAAGPGAIMAAAVLR